MQHLLAATRCLLLVTHMEHTAECPSRCKRMNMSSHVIAYCRIETPGIEGLQRGSSMYARANRLLAHQDSKTQHRVITLAVPNTSLPAKVQPDWTVLLISVWGYTPSAARRLHLFWVPLPPSAMNSHHNFRVAGRCHRIQADNCSRTAESQGRDL